MTPEEQRIAIAEARGWKLSEMKTWSGKSVWEKDGQYAALIRNGVDIQAGIGLIPHYLNDLNAMHEAEKTLDTDERIEAYLEFLTDAAGGDTRKGVASFTAYFATASQRAEAFLRTLNLWTT